MSKTDIRSLTYEELSEKLSELNLPKFRTAQIYSWLYEKGVTSFDEMTNLSKDLRAVLSDNFEIKNCRIDLKQVSKLDGTVKYLYELDEGEFVECVVMKYKYGYSVCISTQLGCKMGCKFCASAIGGFKRHLTPSEMLSEIYTAQKDLNVKISHIVLMGTGEPLDNFDNVLRFLELVTDEKGLNISIRHISLSTCGIVPKIYELAKLKLQINLAVSLHAPNDEIRRQTMPVAKAYPMDMLLKACRDYFEVTGRRVTFEYALISGVNDSDENAQELAKKLKGLNCHVNLIPVNPVKGTGYNKSDIKRQQSFTDILTKSGTAATVRRTLGSDINASCGQLKRNHINNKEDK